MSMSISGLGSLFSDPIGPSPQQQPGVDPKDRAADTNAGRESRHGHAAAASASEAGTPGAADPEMWSLLTADERSFYLRSAVRGPATYAPGANPSPEPSAGHRLGGRIDLRI